MKKVYALVMIVLISCNIKAQTSGSISMGAGYVNEIFWKMQNGVAGSAAVNSWELAFRIGLQNSSIFINSANGVSLFHVPNTDTSGWYALDTTGLHSWQQLFNSDTSWEYGAFDRSSTGFPDFSWGDYDFNTHVVTGDSLYILKTGNGAYKKLWIIKKDYGNWTFRFANLDNTGDQTVVINGADYANKNFVYYSVSNNSILDLEPNFTDWDILFTRYMTLLPPDNTPYLVTGVLNNVGVNAAQATQVDLNTVQASSYSNDYTNNISEIGYDWKFFNMNSGQYELVDSLCYFVKATDGNIYKLVFTGFEGASTGNINWEQTNLLTSVSDLQLNLGSAAVYPNPAHQTVNLVFDALPSVTEVNVMLNALSGKEVFSAVIAAHAGLNQQQLSLPQLSDGVYLLSLRAGSEVLRLKLIITD